MPFKETFSWFVSSSGRWFRRHLTATALFDGMKTAIWVVPLTVLIWVYAEQEQSKDEGGQQVQFEVHSADPDRIVTLLRPSDDMALIEIHGSKASVENVKRLLQKPEPLVHIRIPANVQTGMSNYVIANEIANSPIFKSNGVVVSSVSPSSVQINVEKFKEITIDVKAPPGAPIVGDPVFTPSSIKLRAPSGAIDKASSDAKPLFAYARIPTSGDLAKPGQHDNVILALDLPVQGENVTATPQQVTASFNIKQNDAREKLDSLSVRRSYPGEMDAEWSVDAPTTVANVNIRGPKDQIDHILERIRTGNNPPYATLRIDSSDKGKEGTKLLEFNMGEPDVMVIDPGSYQVRYSVKRRNPAG
jgi:hypothetical protein